MTHRSRIVRRKRRTMRGGEALNPDPNCISGPCGGKRRRTIKSGQILQKGGRKRSMRGGQVTSIRSIF